MTKRLILFVGLIAILLLALITAIIVIIISLSKGISAEPLPYFPTHTIQVETQETFTEVIPTLPLIQTAAPTSSNLPAPELSFTPTVEASPTNPPPAQNPVAEQSLCQIPSNETFLLIGEDSSTGEPPFGAEWIRLVRVDMESKKITVVSFPRFLDLPTPDLYATYGIPQYVLGTIYHIIYQRVANQPDAAIVASNAVGQAIFDNFGVVSTHFLTINQNSLMPFTALLEPLTVENPSSFSTEDFEFLQGTIELNQNNAWDFLLSNTPPQTEYDRLHRQDQYLIATYQKIRSELLQSDLSNWIAQNKNLLITDLSMEQLDKYACVFYSIPPENIEFLHFSENWLTVSEQKMVLVNRDEAREFLTQLFTQP